jgi:hypothetical protein
MGRRKATGAFETRAELVEEILALYQLRLSDVVIARRTGVSTTTVATIIMKPEKR